MTVHTGKGHNRPGQRYWGQGNYVWNNDGDKATVRTNSFKLIDRCRWGDLRHLHAVVTTGRAWDPQIASHGIKKTSVTLAA